MNSIVVKEIREFDSLDESLDRFNYRHLGAHLLKYIMDRTWPISVGIYGRWGSGKSTLVNFLSVYARNKGVTVSIYDAVKYRNVSTQLLIKKIKKDNRVFVFYYLPYIIGLSFFVAAYYFVKPKLILFVGVPVLVLRVIVEYCSNHLSWINDFVNTRYVNSIFFGKNIVIIDNLDRLLPAQAISFLEQLNSVLLRGENLFSKKTAYIIPCDFEILQEEIRSLYKNKKIDAADYLNKLIEIPFYLPSIQAYIPDFVRSLLSDQVSSEEKEKIVKIFPSRSIFVDTPRDIKNYLLQLDMICLIAESRGKEETFLKENLASILVVQIIRSKFKSFYDFLWVNGERFISNGESPRNLRYFFYRAHISPGNSLSEDKFRELSPKFGNSDVSEKYDESERLLELTHLMEGRDERPGLLILDKKFMEIVDIVGSASQAHQVKLSEGGIGVSSIGLAKIGT